MKSSKQEYQKKSQLAQWLPYIFFMIVVIAILQGILLLRDEKHFPFRHVTIKVDQTHIAPLLIQQIVSTHLHGSFFSLDVNELEQALLAIPWVHDVSFSRIWPDRLLVSLHEQQAVARFGAFGLVNSAGELFTPPVATLPNNLPQLDGPMNSQRDLLMVWQRYSRLLSPLGLKITALRLDDRLSLQLTLNNHMIVLLGRTMMDERLTQFLAWYPRVIGAREMEVETIDLRYPNGIAVQWKMKPNQDANSNSK